MAKLRQQRDRRKQRTRRRLIASPRPRLCITRSLMHIYAQVIDDIERRTLVSASSQDKKLALAKTSSVEEAEKVGEAIDNRALAAGVKQVVFDRGA